MKRDIRTAVVTGGGQGIGKAIARQLLGDGFAVAIADSDREAGKETKEEYRGLGEIVFVQADVSKEPGVRSMITRTVRRFGRIDVLVCNAGVYIERSVESLSLREWRRILDVNLTGVFLCAKHAAPFLREGRGSIVNIASTRAIMSEPGTEAYAASKGGVVALSHALALSLGPEVRVNCISPGWIELSGWKKKGMRKRPRLREIDHLQHPAGRVGRPEDIAALVSFLCSGDAGFITGANFIVDGGMTRKMIYE